MFVPCDENGNILEDPNWETFKGYTDRFYVLDKQFKTVKEKVLFKGFSIRTESKKTFVGIEGYEIEISMLPKIKMKIEDLANDWNHIELTEAAIKQIGI
ncbi:hypothetical protein [Chryseobacterium indoltheticum]|uniref:Uncharacterized protein n=1 Tax=Chryseobacterium indoltheticum TaxID=254 RepID=A0A3G6MZW5_9FLAO|nr:hypothetical protein [Chryseobacterium indoltheticum]AZA60787.1 hypothetical protein EG340_06915 [Chryseobacterium indoltheticum]